jgi:hypothetical protein
MDGKCRSLLLAIVASRSFFLDAKLSQQKKIIVLTQVVMAVVHWYVLDACNSWGGKRLKLI